MIQPSRRLNNDQLLNILTLSKDATAIYTGEELIIEIANDAIIGFWGKDRSVIGQSFIEAVPELVGQPFFGLLQEVWRTGVTYEATDMAAQLRVGGRLQWFYYDFIYRAIKNEKGEVYCILHTATDVTARHLRITEGLEREQELQEEITATNEELKSANAETIKANEALSLSKSQLVRLNAELEQRVSLKGTELTTARQEAERQRDRIKRFFMQAPAGICILDGAEFVFELINPLYQQLFPGRELLGKPLLEAVPEIKGAPIWDVLQDVYQTGKSFEGDELLIPLARTSDGPVENRYFNFIYQARQDESGLVDGILVFVIEVTEQVNNRKAVEQAKENLQMAIDAAELGPYYINTTDRIFHPSARLKEFFGFAPDEEVPYEAAINQIHEDYRQAAADLVEAAITKGVRFDMEYPVVGFHDGKIRWVRGIGEVQHHDGKSYFTGVLHEITERKLAEKQQGEYTKELQSINEEMVASNEELAATNEELIATQQRLEHINRELAESTSRLRMAIESTNLGTWDYNPQTHDLYWSKECRDVYGYPENQPVSFSAFSDHLHPDDRTWVEKEIEKAIDPVKGGHYDLSFRIVRFDNAETRWVKVNGRVYFEDDKAVQFIGTVLDITELKEAEEKSAKLAAIIQSSDDAIISKTFDSVITSWNTGAQRIFGYRAEEMIGESIYKLIPADRQDEEPEIIKQLRSGERIQHYETKRQTKDGRLIDVSLTISPVKDSQGNIIGISKIARDITEKKLDETRKSDFIGMVSHELKTPLTSLGAIIQVANAKLKNSEDVFLTGAMQKANLQVKRMTAMINGFLNISRLESGKIHIAKQEFDMEALISDVIEEANISASTHLIHFVKCAPVLVNADYEKIGSVISNYISNAIKYSPNGKNIEVLCVIKDDQVVVSVKDEGIGIKPQDINKIFDRYYRVETVHTKRISGFGIGLYLSSEIIKRHGGRAWADSQIGVGSTFYFSLPLEAFEET